MEAGTVKIAAHIPPQHLAKLRAHAIANDRSLSAEVRRMVRMYVAVIDRPATDVHGGANGSAELELAPIPDQ